MLHQRGIIEVTPATLRDRLATMEATLTAFDGAFLRLPATGELITKATAVKASAIAADLEPLYALRPTRFKYNFAVVPMQRDLDVFDDWTVPLANLGALAKVARDAGLVGIVIDNESLSGFRVSYPYDVKFAERARSRTTAPRRSHRPQDHAGDRRRVPGRSGRGPARPRRRRRRPRRAP